MKIDELYKKDLYESLKDFEKIYSERPVKDNMGGMLSPHLFNTWYFLKNLKPKLIIESGVWKGLGTWIFEKAVPDCKIISIDITFNHLVYKSNKVKYLNEDIKKHDWEKIFSSFPDIKRDEIVVFLDDHQNFLDRLSFLKSLGIKHVLYEDNYPTSQGDCLSPKKILSCEDYIIDKAGERSFNKYSYYFYDEFQKYVELYEELPPIFKLEKTRWGDFWDDFKYPTKNAILTNDFKDDFPIFYKEAPYYTWICYLLLKE